jgi:basic membrane lipoprotein Med (substrate-binding protein (PBP1-ABC) superfamily)
MSGLGPETVLASIVWDMTPTFDPLIEQTAAGSFQGKFIRYGVKEGALDVAVNPNLSAEVPDAVDDASRLAFVEVLADEKRHSPASWSGRCAGARESAFGSSG